MIEKLLEIISPDVCVLCSAEGQCLCETCSKTSLIRKKPSCVFCNQLNDDGKTCRNCYAKSKLRSSVIAYRYQGAVKDLVWKMKYQNGRSIARYFAAHLDKVDGVVCYVPSDGKTRRMRGYDQAEILAKKYAKINQLEFQRLLLRSQHTRQVGKSRNDRMANIKDNFIATKPLDGMDIVLIDDVITTGATISECAKTLKNAGAKSVTALAVAKG